MTVLAVGAGGDGAGTFLALVFLLGMAYLVLRFFRRRIGGKGGGAEKASIGAWFLLAAIVVGFLVATGR
ncbi:hypothetical protein [Pseudonocardia acaciae]|uniref:hypothetical protein n=1 Tax=Pseudonocardia acaciae TaxID=551276 RepID=UPI00048D3AE4|nr:hypothetical protein [Pseudonocardia acaciae]